MTQNTETVVRRSTLVAAGLSNHSLATRCRPGGPWQQLLPGVLLLKSGPPSRRQRLKAAVLYAGAEAVITGVQSLREHGLHAFESDEVHMLIPGSRRLSSREYVRIERTSRMPKPRTLAGLRFAPPHRAAVDAARRTRDPTEQRALLFATVDSGLCTIEQLRIELDAGAQRGTAGLRTMLDECLLPQQTSTVQLGWARRVLKGAPFPDPEWHVPLHTKTGGFLGTADAWWDNVGLVWDFGNQRDNRTDHRVSTFTKSGLMVVHTPVPQLRSHPETVLRALARGYHEATHRPRPPIHTIT